MAMRAFTDSFTVSNPAYSEKNYTVNFTTVYILRIPSASKRNSSIVLPQRDGGVFPTFVAKRQRPYKSQKVLQNSKNKLSLEEI